MGVVFENNLTAAFFVLLALAAVAGLSWGLWKPVGRRAWRYFLCWWERDAVREREARSQRDARRQAESEVNANLYGDDPAAQGEPVPQASAPSNDVPTTSATPLPYLPVATTETETLRELPKGRTARLYRN